MKQQRILPKSRKGQYLHEDDLCPLKSEKIKNIWYRCNSYCPYYKYGWATKGEKQIDGVRKILKFTVWCFYPEEVE